MFNELVSSICASMALNGCPETLKATGIKTHLSENIDGMQRLLEQKVESEAYSILGKKTIEYSITAGTVANSIVTKSIQFKTPLKPLIDEIDLNANPNGYILNWKWYWK